MSDRDRTLAREHALRDYLRSTKAADLMDQILFADELRGSSAQDEFIGDLVANVERVDGEE